MGRLLAVRVEYSRAEFRVQCELGAIGFGIHATSADRLVAGDEILRLPELPMRSGLSHGDLTSRNLIVPEVGPAVLVLGISRPGPRSVDGPAGA